MSPRGLVQVSLAAVLWGTGGLTVQLIRRWQEVSPLVLSADRALLGAFALLVVLLVTGGGRELVQLLRTRPLAAIGTGLGTGAYQALYFVAVTDAGVAIPTVISLGLAPVLLAAADAGRARRWPRPRLVLVLVVAIAGITLVSLAAGVALGPHPGRGVLLSIGSGIVYAATTGWGQAVAGVARPLVLTTGSIVVSALALSPFLFLGGGAPASLGVGLGLIYLGVGTMALSYGLFYAGLRTVPASAAAVASLLEPVTAALAAALVLGEHLGGTGIVGTVLVLLAVVGLAAVGLG